VIVNIVKINKEHIKKDKTMEKQRTFEQEAKTKNPGGFFAGLFLGGLAGAVTALLFAPQSGEETRQQIQQRASTFRDDTTAAVEDVVSQVRTKSGEVKATVSEKAKELKKQGQEVLVDQLDRVSAAAETGKKAIQGKDS
jgi:gas vesicle protein